MVTLLATEQITVAANKRLCQCGCGESIDRFDRQHKERFYKFGHTHKGRKLSEGHRLKIGLAMKGKLSGDKHHQWKGDNVKYCALHVYVNKYKPKPIDGLCEFCHLKPYEDLACITRNYNRDPNNYRYLCTLCHMRYDIANNGMILGRRKNIQAT
jgi:hypothetical protein